MSIHISVNSRPLRGFLRCEKPSAAAAVSAKAGELVALAKLRRAVDDLEEEIMLRMCAIGELVYATHCGDPSDSEELQKILTCIDDLRDEVAGHEQEIKRLRGVIACPVCGEDVSLSDIYCEKCGQPMPVPESQQS